MRLGHAQLRDSLSTNTQPLYLTALMVSVARLMGTPGLAISAENGQAPLPNDGPSILRLRTQKRAGEDGNCSILVWITMYLEVVLGRLGARQENSPQMG
ncbi:Sodium- and chloride-dependent GABA transporter 1 [Clarias magur]|uniref:Sodium- and chloride-dependent GABA transporter 1 n=1 Tax=Clarias magur TaxID=1594786 RepID=A0A8J4TPP2_CLAMG|nr:Sodium- and chloride-dependent GABA transporter 1 [Clarias magur]